MFQQRLRWTLRRMAEIKRRTAELDAEYGMLQDEIKAHMTTKGVDVLQVDDLRVSWTDVTSSKLDTKAFKAEMPEVYDRFLRESTTKRFVISAVV